ncbi:hypothetical protein WOC76_22260 [Methylocystis sp. IM3]|uniref:hemerythrin domain-containing protein n=1 Tax=unclassified Methylocystis TaxID=2625913 RepID=UPI0030FB6320
MDWRTRSKERRLCHAELEAWSVAPHLSSDQGCQMRTVIQLIRRDHHEIEALLGVLEEECVRFGRAERPDYELLHETTDCLRSLLDHFCWPREDLLIALVKNRKEWCDRTIANVLAERAVAASSLQALSDHLRDILNEQRVSRQSFCEAACKFLQHERRQIEGVEREFLPVALSVLTPSDWADVRARQEEEENSQVGRDLKKRLRTQRHWVLREAAADKNERSRRQESPIPEGKL